MAEEQVTKRSQLTEEQANLLMAYQEVFTSDAGQMVLDDLAREVGFYASKFNENSDRTAFNCGREEVFILIQRKLAEARNLDKEIKTEVD